MKKLLFPIIILLIGIAVYSNSLHGEFHYDDYQGIVVNPAIKSLDNIADVRRPYNTFTRFIPFLTFALNYHFHGLNVFGYHLVNLIIHLSNALLVFWLFQLIMQSPPLKKSPWVKRTKELALLAGLIFVTHPVQVQAVSYIYQRMASMATLWYLLTMCFYIKARINHSHRLKYFCLALTSALLGIFTKEIFFTIPVVIMMSEILLFGENYNIKKWRQSMQRNHSVLFFMLLLTIIVLFIPYSYNRTPLDVMKESAASQIHAWETVNFGNYIPTQMRVIMTYLRLLVFPINQRFDYDFYLSYSFFEPKVLLSFMTILSLLTFAWCYRRKNVLMSFGIFWFFIALCVESIFPIRNIIWEFRVYLPMTGFCFFLTGLFAQHVDPKRLKIIAVLLISTLGLLTFQRNQVYRSEISLWEEVVSFRPKTSRAYSHLGASYIEQKKFSHAIPHLKKALQYKPDHRRALFNLVMSLVQLKRYDEAVVYAFQLYSLDPEAAINPSMLAFLYYQQRDYFSSFDYYQKTLLLEGTEDVISSYTKVIRDFYDIHHDKQTVMKQIAFLEKLNKFPEEVAALKEYIK